MDGSSTWTQAKVFEAFALFYIATLEVTVSVIPPDIDGSLVFGKSQKYNPLWPVYYCYYPVTDYILVNAYAHGDLDVDSSSYGGGSSDIAHLNRKML